MKIEYSPTFKWLRYLDQNNSNCPFMHFYLQVKGIDIKGIKIEPHSIISVLYWEGEERLVFRGVKNESNL